MTDSLSDPKPRPLAESSIKAGAKPAAREKRESLLANLLLNIIIPTLILLKLSGDQHLGTRLALVLALAFPILYGLWYFAVRRKVNVFSVLGFVSILLTGGIGLLELDSAYIAIKEAAIPALVGLAVLISLKTPYPLVKTLLYNDRVLKVDKVATALRQHNNETAFEKTLTNATYIIAASFFLSSVLNYVLAKRIVVSPSGTVQFNEELGKLTAMSFPVIVVPAMIVMMIAFFYLFRSIRRLTHLTLEDVINDGSSDDTETAAPHDNQTDNQKDEST